MKAITTAIDADRWARNAALTDPDPEAYPAQ
jgi:hypothetical protein